MISNKRKGPAPTGQGVQVMLRVQPQLLVALDEWIAKQSGVRPTRQQVIRHFLEKGIGYSKPSK